MDVCSEGDRCLLFIKLLGKGKIDVRSVLILIIIILILLLVLVGTIYFVYRRARDKVEEFSEKAFGTSDIMEGMRQMEREAAVTPRSVSSATNLYLPSIMRDFPEFHYDEMKTRAENVLTSYLRSVDAQNSTLLTEGTNELREQLAMRIQMRKRQEQREYFENIRIHRTEIHQYRKAKGRRSVVLQSAVEYIHYVEKDGEVTEGRRDMQKQAKYNVEVMYIQDQEQVENLGDAGLGLNCPNCGAPLSGIGAKKCAYCDTPVVEFNIRTWNFSKVTEV